MIKKNNSSLIKLIKYYNFINYNLIYNNRAINRYKKDNFEISADKSRIVVLKIMRQTSFLVMVIPNQR